MTSSTLELHEEETAQTTVSGDLWLHTHHYDPLFCEAVNERITHLDQLQPNWDGYGAPKIGAAVIALARKLVDRLSKHGIPRPHVVPLSSGTLQFEWRDEQDRGLELEIEPPETIHYLRWDPAAGIEDEDYLSFAADEHAAEDHLRWLTRWFMQGPRTPE